MKENDGLPGWICKECSELVMKFYEFVKVFQKSEKYLKEMEKRQELNSEEILSADRTEIIKCEDYCSDSDEKDELQYQHQENMDDISENISVDSVKYSCEECGDCFLFKVGFQQHMNKKHDIEITDFEKYSSKIKIKVAPIEDSLEPIVMIKNDLQCKNCKAIFESHGALDEHISIHKKHTCEHCGATFTKKSYFIDHLEIHSSIKHHICKICGKSYRRRNGLRYHKKIHLNLRNLICEKCGKRFNHKGNLRTHIKLKHTSEKNFQCTFCGLSFAMNSWLRKHMLRRHAGERERNYVCNICGIAYFEKGTLSRHISVKHNSNGKKYSCTSCGKDYTTRTNLNKHFRSVHDIISKSSASDI